MSSTIASTRRFGMDAGESEPMPMRVAIVHDWCPDFRGGERVLSDLCKLFPGAEVFTLFDFLSPEVKREHFPGVRFHTSVANRLPYAKRFYRHLFPICPFLIEQFDVTNFDAVITSSAAFARGVLTRPDQPHLCYVHTPIRYAWDEQFSYLQQGRLGYGFKGIMFRYFAYKLRQWDTRTAHSPDLMLANSSYVRSRIRRIYGRQARVVFPPVALSELQYASEKDDYYVTASFLAPYKRTDLVLKAFAAMPNRRLVVLGDGQQGSSLRKLATPNIEFAGFLPRAEYLRSIAKARAFVFAGCEDFGIASSGGPGLGNPSHRFRTRRGQRHCAAVCASPIDPRASSLVNRPRKPSSVPSKGSKIIATRFSPRSAEKIPCDLPQTASQNKFLKLSPTLRPCIKGMFGGTPKIALN